MRRRSICFVWANEKLFVENYGGAVLSSISSTAILRENIIIGNNVVIEDDVFIDHNCIIRNNVRVKRGSWVGAQCILGEYISSFFDGFDEDMPPLVIGENSLIRSGTIVYCNNELGSNLQTGHRVTIREKTITGHHVRIGTLSDIQGNCSIGNYVNIHSNVHIGQHSIVKDFAWLFPYVVLTNDPTPPSLQPNGVVVDEFAVVSTGSIVLPGVHIGKDALVGASANVTKNVPAEMIAVGNPAKVVGNTASIKNKFTSRPVYPWRYTFDRGMPWEGIGYDTWAKKYTRNK